VSTSKGDDRMLEIKKQDSLVAKFLVLTVVFYFVGLLSKWQNLSAASYFLNENSIWGG